MRKSCLGEAESHVRNARARVQSVTAKVRRLCRPDWVALRRSLFVFLGVDEQINRKNALGNQTAEMNFSVVSFSPPGERPC